MTKVGLFNCLFNKHRAEVVNSYQVNSIHELVNPIFNARSCFAPSISDVAARYPNPADPLEDPQEAN